MGNTPLKIYYMTFGCKVNQYETENIAERFSEMADMRTEDIGAADVCIINSCTVTAQSDTKCRHFISRVKRENPACIIALTGCYPQAFPDKASQIAECDIICGNNNKTALPQMVHDYFKLRKRTFSVPENYLHQPFEHMMNAEAEQKTRAYLKIQDGCDLFCTYCIIPYARGHMRSKPIGDIIKETEMLVSAGHKEIVLTGINLCCYGRDLGGLRMIDAIEAVCKVEGDFRVRLGSMEPEMISDEDIARMAAQKKLCPQFHLSLQSGCDKTLKAMNRHYTSAEYAEICRKLRAAFPHCAITTDIMAGFPQESAEDHAESLRFAEKTAFADAHIFPYSRRSGTPADKMSGQLDKKTKAARAAEMAAVCAKSRAEYNRSFIGRTVEVLFERESSAEHHQGHIAEYVVVKTPRTSDESLFRQKRLVKITSADENGCGGEIVG